MTGIAPWILIWACGAAQDPRASVPGEDEQAKAEKEIRDVFKDEYAVKTSAAQRKLAKTLLGQGRETREDSALRYVLFREAADLALRSGDLDVLLGAMDSLGRGFAVDAVALKASSLAKADAVLANPEDFRKLTQALIDVARDAALADQFDLAAKTAQAALASAKKAKEIPIATLADGTLRSVQEAKASYERAKKAEAVLKANPEDPAANQAVGEYLCFNKDQWAQGLPFLSKGSDPALKPLAAKELAAPAQPSARVEVADGWWDLGTGEKSSIRKNGLLGHARALYEAELPNASGLTRAKIDSRLAQKGPAGLLPAGPPRVNRSGLLAWWRCDEGSGTTVANSAGPGNVATLLNGMEWIPGRVGKALKFDGRSGYLSCSAEHLPATNAPQTLSFWINVSSRSARGEDVLCLSDDGCTGALQAGVSAQDLAFWKFGGGLLGKAAPPVAETWHHCAFVTDGKTHLLYVDAKLEHKSVVPPQAVPVTQCEFGRYRGPGGEGRYFSGALDEIRIYNRALSEAEVQGVATGNE